MQAARRRGIFHIVESGSTVTTDTVVQRVIANRSAVVCSFPPVHASILPPRVEYVQRNAAKEARELGALAAAKASQGMSP